MRALLCNAYGPPESLVIETLDDPVPGPNDVLVDIHAAGINFPDVLVIAGKYQVKTEPPFIPGSEAAGVVAVCGAQVSRFKPGERVIITPTGGAFAEKCIVNEALCTPLDSHLDFKQGAGFTITYATSYHALKQCAQLKAGETVLVMGAAGGVGITAVEIAHAMGARVIAAASSEEKLDFARAAGADETINYSSSALKEAIKDLTAGKGVDVVYDPVGGVLAQQTLRSLSWHGRYLVIGFASGDIPDFPANIALLKEASIIGVWWGTWAQQHPESSRQNMAELASMIEQGRIHPVITQSYRLDEYLDAFAAITQRKALGKVVLTITQQPARSSPTGS